MSIKSLPNLLFGVLCLPGDRSHPVAQPTINPLAHCICWARLLGRAVFPPWNKGPNFGSYTSTEILSKHSCLNTLVGLSLPWKWAYSVRIRSHKGRWESVPETLGETVARRGCGVGGGCGILSNHPETTQPWGQGSCSESCISRENTGVGREEPRKRPPGAPEQARRAFMGWSRPPRRQEGGRHSGHAQASPRSTPWLPIATLTMQLSGQAQTLARPCSPGPGSLAFEPRACIYTLYHCNWPW